jgi:hypothetical protein
VSALFASLSANLSAQQPSPSSVTVTGVVRDSTTGAAVSGALVTVSNGPRAIAGADGRFTLQGVSLGARELVVQRFGYVTLQTRVTVTAPAPSLDLRMTPDPLQLQGLTVMGNAQAPLSGVVLDRVSDERLQWAGVWLSQDAVREAGRTTADAQGVFSIDDVTTGAYLLRVEKLGYFGQYIPIGHVVPPVPLEVRLEPDTVLLRGLAALNERLGGRRKAASGTVRAFGEERLKLSAMRGMRDFLQADAALPLSPCAASDFRNNCLSMRGRMVAPRVYIDERPAMGLDELDTYQPGELFSVDVFTCTAADLRGGWEVHVYTYAFMEQQGRRARAMFGACTAP